jgi:SulP family sulfate permease
LIVLIVLAAIGFLGVLEGVGVGLLLAVIFFVVNYSRIEVIKHSLSGVNFHSNVGRIQAYSQWLRRRGEWLHILQLQGFLFFGTANKLLDQVMQRLNAPDLVDPHYIVFDFRQVNGIDASTSISFQKIMQHAQAKDLILVFTQLKPEIQAQLEKTILTAETQPHWRVFPDLDRGVEWCEEQIIQRLSEVGLPAQARSAKQELEHLLSGSKRFAKLSAYLSEDQEDGPAEPISIAALQKYLEKMEFNEDEYLIRIAEPPRGLYFIETGRVTVQIELEDGKTIRLRRLDAGTTVGEMGLYLGTKTSASVVANELTTVYFLSVEHLRQMEDEDPEIASSLHKLIVRELAGRLLAYTETIDAFLR